MSTEYGDVPTQELPATNEGEMVTLYRIENPNIPVDPQRFGGQGAVSHPDLVGQWFSPNIETASLYLNKSRRVPGARLVAVSIPKDKLEEYHVHNNPLTQGMDVEVDNYIVPSKIPRTTISLDDVETRIGVTRRAQIAEKVRVLLAP